MFFASGLAGISGVCKASVGLDRIFRWVVLPMVERSKGNMQDERFEVSSCWPSFFISQHADGGR